MKLANEDVSMLAFTSEQITAPFLLPEMVSIGHLHFSSLYVSPDRKFFLWPIS